MLVNLKSQQKPLELGTIQYKYSDRIANHLIKAFYLIRSFSKVCRSVYFSQEYIGSKLGISPNRACEIVNILASEGFIIIHGRQSKTCEYEIPAYYLEEEQEFKLNKFYKQFMAFSVSFIISISANSDTSRQLSFYNLKDLNKSDSISVSNEAKCVAPQATLLSKKEIKQRKTVISEQRLQAIMEINKIFPLSPHGIVKLSVYSAAALQYVYKQADMALSKYDPFGYLANLCNEFDAKSGCTPDWEAYHLRREALGIAKEDTIFIDQERFDAMERTQESKPTFAPAPVKKTPKRDTRETYTMAHTPEEIRSMPIPVVVEGKPERNSQAYFASLLLGIAPKDNIVA